MQHKKIVKWKEVMAEANKQIAHLMEQLREGPRKMTLHMKKIMDKFRKQTKEDIEIAAAIAGMVLTSSGGSGAKDG